MGKYPIEHEPLGLMDNIIGCKDLCKECYLNLWMIYDSVMYLKKIQCSLRFLQDLFGFGALGEVDFREQFYFIRTQVSLSKEETGRQNDIVAIGVYLYAATLKSNTTSRRMIRSAMARAAQFEKTVLDDGAPRAAESKKLLFESLFSCCI
ncbi:hypothetical protein TNCV_4935411 [Trichonephila clavipes]|nr:hypothetical protein TNCV_4935411 [Trichonephila clavipes]